MGLRWRGLSQFMQNTRDSQPFQSVPDPPPRPWHHSQASGRRNNTKPTYVLTLFPLTHKPTFSYTAFPKRDFLSVSSGENNIGLNVPAIAPDFTLIYFR